MQVEQRTWTETSGWSGPLVAPVGGTTVILLFGGRISPAILAEVEEAFPDAIKLGCSTSGEICGQEISDDGVSLVIVNFSQTKAKVVVLPAHRDAGRELGEMLSQEDLAHVFVLSEGLGINGSDLVAGLRDALDPSVVLTGGLAGDGDRFGSTWVWAGNGPLADHIVALGLYGDALEVTHARGGGWDPFGIERTVTRSTGNVLFELDGRPALALYKEYLGDLAEELPAMGLLFPLALLDRHGDDVVRTILAVDERDQSLTFAGDVPEGSRVRLMRANLDRLIEGAIDAAELIRPKEPVLALVVSCVGRRLVLNERVEEEIEAVADVLPEGSAIAGFFSYGELAPTADGTTDLHNQTITLTMWRERSPLST